ncbi:hypothetical protein HG536_0A01940 [Torulaspora globosa]|uniref:Uncharacterized protein n=1 Tax=Torulaspora globosa TaxID=48254 RepID=A0A7G3ZA41_9SACH|nr:uncharacterized protein HG536_0A01940 [Torulaspora globosa]QLL30377.1 hypothetical protein HG536_0A01940 [Torulaspora globosa]
MTVGEGHWLYAKEHLANLRRLNAFCLAFEPKPASALDPMSQLCNQTRTISKSVTSLIEYHSSCDPNDHLAIQSSFMNSEILNLYNEILLGSIKLIFAIETSLFRLGPSLEFAICIVKLYSKLTNYQKLLGGKSTQLSSMLHSFEFQFKQGYITADNNVIRLDNIHDLSSHTYDLVAPPIINLDDVVKRDFFRLSMNKFNMQRQLVEILQFTNGEIAIFKVISGELPNAKDPPTQLLARLLQGDYSPLNLGRALLFPFLRDYDLDVIGESVSGIELRTVTGNNVHLKLQCVDALQWEGHWKFCMKKLFDRNNFMQLTPSIRSSASLAKSSHLFQNFKMKHNKLENLRPAESTGLSLTLPNQAMHVEQSSERSEPDKPSQSGLRRSKPLQGPLSILMSMDEEDDEKATVNNQSSLSDCKHPSFEDLDSLDCEKLMELDKGIQMEFSPVSLESPSLQQYKSVSQHSSMDEIRPIAAKSIEVDDFESIISSADDETDCRDDSSIFNPSAEFYKPALYRRKSSSLLSLFSSRNKKGLFIDAAGANSAASLTPTSKENTPLSAKSNIPVYPTEKTHQLLPSTIDLNNDLAIFESEKARTSFWDGRQWMRFGSESLRLSILRSINDETVLVAYESKVDGRCFFAARVSHRWTCSKAAAQDIQAIIPSSDFLCSILPPGKNTVNIRCSRSEGLLNALQHCIKGNLPAFIPSSQTANTLSSFPSSSASNGITRSSTGISDFAGFKNATDAIASLLLLPSVKAKIHERIDEKGWQVQNIGHVDIFSQEYKGSAVAVRFDFFGVNEIKQTARTLISRLSDIRRIGRTGLLVASGDDERLLEFVNKVIADQVYKLIKPL